MPTHSSLPAKISSLLPLSAVFALALVSPSRAQVVIPSKPVIGSSNPITAEPLVERPSTKPCTVILFTGLEFANFDAKTFSYAPPTGCPGPWAKVIFKADFNVTAGVQYDRTAQFYLGHSNIFFGTTAEPGSTLSPSWHVERDVTDLSAVFAAPQSGEADLGNLVNSTYTGKIYANAALEFFPTSPKVPAAAVPDIVVPLPDTAGGAFAVNSTTTPLTQSVTLPTNVERAYLDVIAQSQSSDEFWYTCVPDDVATQLESCSGTGFRETEVLIDGIPAGVAPVYPWIYTGGIDPFLWLPITGVQTLDFKPYRVDLTPFAGVLADGSAHVISIGVFNADSYFAVTGNLLVYTDHGSTAVSGGVLSNTLSAAPTPTVTEKLNLDSSGNGTATVSVGSKRQFSISGAVLTSHGKVTTTVFQDIDFLNSQNFTLSDTTYVQDITQSTTVNTSVTTRAPLSTTVAKQYFSYPFSIDINVVVNPDGSESQTTTSSQGDQSDQKITGPTGPFFAYANEVVKSTDTLNFDASGNFTGNTGTASSATDYQFNSEGGYYYQDLTSAGGVLTGISDTPPAGDKK